MVQTKTATENAPVAAAKIAAHLGGSKANVTHVLNGRGIQQRICPGTQQRICPGTQQRICPGTQQRVLGAAQALGYRPNVSARAI